MAEMKPSGVQWIGDIPVDWNISVLGRYVKQVKNKNTDLLETNLLSLSYGKVKRKDISANDGLLPASFDGYNIIEEGDIVLRLTDLQNDHTSLRVGRATERGIITSAYVTIRPEKYISSEYLYYVLHSFDIVKGFYGMGAGIRQGLTYDGVQSLKIPSPAMPEQQAIADYLDDRCSKIDEIIAEVTASIEEYKELKQAVIFEAVTKGLDKNVPMRNTGNLWLPELPVDVPLSRVSLHYTVILGKMLCPNKRDDDDSLEPYYCAANVHFDGISGALKEMWFNTSEKESYSVHKADMLIVEGGAGAGGAAIVEEEPEQPTFVQNSIMIVRSKDSEDNRYLCYLVQALVKSKYVDFVCNKATIPHFTKEKVSGRKKKRNC